MKRVLKLVLPTFAVYAERHGYELVVGSGQEGDPRPVAWSKVPLIRRLLLTYDEVLWVDSDALILRTDIDISDVVPPDDWQALVEVTDAEEIGRHINTGVWFLRSKPEAFSFLDVIWESEDLIHHPWWENAAALRALGYTLEFPLHRTTESPWWRGTSLLPPEWNSLHRCPVPSPRVVHYSAVPNRERARLIRAARGLTSDPFEDLVLRARSSRRVARISRRVRRWISRGSPGRSAALSIDVPTTQAGREPQ